MVKYNIGENFLLPAHTPMLKGSYNINAPSKLRLKEHFPQEEFMSRLRILVLAPDSSPEEISIPYVTYSHAAALAQLHDVLWLFNRPLRMLCAAQRRRFAP